MKLREEEIKNWFRYHAPGLEQRIIYAQLRDAALGFANLINSLVPDCADKTAAIRKLREAVMTANAAVACSRPESGLNNTTPEEMPAETKIIVLTAWERAMISSGMEEAIAQAQAADNTAENRAFLECFRVLKMKVLDVPA